MEEIVSLPPMEFFNNDYQSVLDFIEDLGNPKFKIAGDVILYHNKNITTLGNLIEVGGELDLQHSLITELPDNLIVETDLIIANSNIELLPDNLLIGNSLWASGTKISSIPNNLCINDDMFIINTHLSKNYSKDEILTMIEDKGGYVYNEIIVDVGY